MSNEEIYQELINTQLLPLYTATDIKYFDMVEEILIKHNIKLIEVTFRSDLACEAISYLSRNEELIIGAGTVRTVEEAKRAVDSGAQFIVSPAISSAVIEYCQKKRILVFPGVSTPNDIQKAFEYGLKTVKFFPADIYGGIEAIKALSGPYYDIQFLPTGGIDNENFLDYLECKNVIAVGGSFILSESVLEKNGIDKADKNLGDLLNKLNN